MKKLRNSKMPLKVALKLPVLIHIFTNIYVEQGRNVFGFGGGF